MWQVDAGGIRHYRCHTGHSFTDKALLTIQSEKFEETLWTALRMFEERKNLLNNMAAKHPGRTGTSYAQRADETQVHVGRIRAMLQAPQNEAGKKVPKRNVPRATTS